MSGNISLKVLMHGMGCSVLLGILLVTLLCSYVPYQREQDNLFEIHRRVAQNKAKLNGIALKNQELTDICKLIQQSISDVKAGLPESAEDDVLLRQYSRLAHELELELYDFLPLRTSESDNGLSVKTIRASVRGDYPTVRQFLVSLVAFPRVQKISSLSIRKLDTDRRHFELQLEVDAFFAPKQVPTDKPLRL